MLAGVWIPSTPVAMRAQKGFNSLEKFDFTNAARLAPCCCAMATLRYIFVQGRLKLDCNRELQRNAPS